MKNFLLLSIICFLTINLHAQDTPACEPDTSFRTADAGVYPLPLSEMFPDQGITDSARIGEPFNFVFTVVTPDSISIPFGPVVISSPLDSITIQPDTAIMGLPKGIDYACNPPNCTFSSEEVLGCIVLSGTPTDTTDHGDNPLSIQAAVWLPALMIPISFPDPALFPGSYSLFVFPILENVNDRLKEISSFSINPNPSTGTAQLIIESLESGFYALETFNVLGERVQHQQIRLFEGSNTIHFEGDQLTEGMYVISLSNGRQRTSRRLVISR